MIYQSPKRQRIRTIAVENFLGSLDLNMPEATHEANAHADARSYKWNLATLNTILRGIRRAYDDKEKQS